MSDIFQEVDEALRQEKAEKWWKENGKMVLWFCFCLIFFTGAITFGRNWMEKNKAQDTAALIEIVQSDDEKRLQMLEDYASSASDGLGMVAIMTETSNLFADGKVDEALEQLRVYAQDNKGDLYGDYARYLFVSKSLDENKGDYASLKEMLTPLLNDTDNAWHSASLELLGVLEFQNGEFAKAKSVFENLMMVDHTPASRIIRAQKMRHLSDLNLKSQLEENKGRIVLEAQ